MSAHSPAFLELMEKVVPFLQARHEPSARASTETLQDWAAWFWNRGLISWTLPEGEIRGVLFARYFNRLADFFEPSIFEPGGEFGSAELMIADRPEDIRSVFDQMVARWGTPKIFLWDRGAKTAKTAPRMYRPDQIEKIAWRLYGKPKSASTSSARSSRSGGNGDGWSWGNDVGSKPAN